MKRYILLIVSLLIIGAAFVLDNLSHQLGSEYRYRKNVASALDEKTRLAGKFFNELITEDKESIVSICEESREENIILLKYTNDSLTFWSSNSIPAVDFLTGNDYSNRLDTINNSYYYVVRSETDSVTCIGLINLYTTYPYENEFLESGFLSDFKLPDCAEISLDKDRGLSVEYKGSYLFSIFITDIHQNIEFRAILASIILIIGLILLGISLYIPFRNLTGRKKLVAWVILGGIVVLRRIQLGYPFRLGSFLIFDPKIYADAKTIFSASLGDLMINSLLLFFLAVLIAHECRQSGNKLAGLKINSLPGIILQTLVCLLFLFYANYFSRSLIFNSSISFQSGANNQLSVYSFLGYTLNGMNYLSAGMVLVCLLGHSLVRENRVTFLIAFGSTLIAGYTLIGYAFSFFIDPVSLVFFGIIILTALGMRFFNRDLSAYSSLVIFILIFSVYSFVFNSRSYREKNIHRKESLAFSLANEHDPDAESKFEDLSRQIETDVYINTRFETGQIDTDSLWNYLKTNYFSGFWNKYELIITLCRPIDSIGYQCYNDFGQVVNQEGFSLPDSRFYYLNRSVRISYLGQFIFHNFNGNEEISLFIELNLRSDDFFGYPELLLDKRKSEDRLLQGYSYAKYYRGNLVSKAGEFSYSTTTDIFGEMPDDYRNVTLNNYHHLLFRSDEDSIIVISSPQVRYIDILVGFSYIFIFYYLCLIVIMGGKIALLSHGKLLVRLRSKIQFSILSILVISLVLIAFSTVWLNLQTYKQRQYDNLNEKVRSVLIELKHKLNQEEELTPEWHDSKYPTLDRLLIKFSDVFYTDINLYNLNGNLLATSRAEIFNLGLLGDKMDPVAYIRLNQEKRAQFIQQESIGKLEYLSAYVPFENDEGRELAYLNLPYFTRQTELQASVSALILTIVNIYVILVLITIVITIFISDQITRPLAMLQLKFRELKIGNKYEQISYKREDEIGSLVLEYNRMVLELEKSINLLARSERESAWREMAKQIAHEIKNPLTPMRLSIQQLNKLWADKNEDFDKYLNSVSDTLIEQIDNLSAIASEFSNFAQMPVAKFEEVNVVEILDKSVKLFRSNDLTIHFNPPDEEIIIRADKEQLSRVFINLIKNGIQSIPDDKKGEISISVQTGKKHVTLIFQDNGRGIPDEVKPKLFMPNFTTKSSGMGLGLAIVKNIIDQIKGEISFDTRLGEGSAFTLRIPLQKGK
ncbi:MAG: GHKL domain-containing protein [Bacteroidales bacterium]|nr:GHKL domain-containing protein [Bacteroidales bacterium]